MIFLSFSRNFIILFIIAAGFNIILLFFIEIDRIINERFPTQLRIIMVALILYSSLFHPSGIQNKSSYKKLLQWGQISALQYLLNTNFNKGLTDDKNDHEERKRIYGDNQIKIIPQKSLTQIIYTRFEDKILRILLIAAILSIFLKIMQRDIEGGLINGISILAALFIIVIVTSTNNYISEREFHRINNILSIKTVKAYRSDHLKTILASELLVGDIIEIQAGEIIIVDGILIKANDILVDESSITGQKLGRKKTVPQSSSLNENADPFIISQTKILQGSGKLLVLAVGNNTYFGKLKLQPNNNTRKTILQQKLSELQEWVNYFGFFASISIFFLLFINYVYDQNRDSNQNQFTFADIQNILDLALLSVSIIVMCVPQGIQLSMSIVNAYSINQMKQGNNIVRFVEACQIMGGVDNICSDKTGTLTLNNMVIKNIFIEGKNYKVLMKQKISEKVLKIFCLAICNNTTASITSKTKENQIQKQSKEICFQHEGNKTQCALLQTVYGLGFDYRIFRHSEKQVKRFGFDSSKKFMATIYEDDRHLKYAFIKGAPQLLIPYCTKYINQEGIIVNINRQFEDVINDIVQDYGYQSLRTLLIAYKQVLQVPDTWQEVQRDLILIAIVGIKDKLRCEIPSVIEACYKAGINVRMITGDNKRTAISVAKESGLLDDKWYQRDDDCTVMEGRQFRQFVGGIVNEGQPNESIRYLQNFMRVRDELKVLARCSPQDKYMIVLGLQNLGHVVSITGDGNNDAAALKKADIGFAIGMAATEIAKEASHVIVLNENFNSIVSSIKWGRNVYDSIRKFLQFQLSVNFVVIGTIFIGIILFGKSPFNPLQILWINFIMDTLASLALATQPASEQNLNNKPQSSKQKLITIQMWIFIIFQGTIQLLIIIFILVKLPQLLHIPNSTFASTWNDQTGKHSSIFFNTFIFMQMFNEINARKLHLQEFNIFSNFFNNKLFIFIILSTTAFQLFIMRWGSISIKTVQLSFKQNLLCIIVGSIPLYSCLFMKIVIFYSKKCIQYFKKSKML